MAMGRVVAGLDIGTTKVTTIIVEVLENGRVSIIGVGQTVANGLERGMIVDLEATVQAIRRSVDEAERMAGTSIDQVFVGIAGDHIRGMNSKAAVSIRGANNEITEEDVARVTEIAQTINIPPDLSIIHVIPQEFTVDNQSHVREPVRLAGSRLEGEVHVVMGAATAIQNLRRAVEGAGLKVVELVLQPLATSLAVLTEDEMDFGVALIDIGGGTTDVAVFSRRSIRHTAIIGIGGTNVTDDIGSVLGTPREEAEMLKREHGRVAPPAKGSADRPIVSKPGFGGRKSKPVDVRKLTLVVKCRMEEILELAWGEIERTGHAGDLGNGVVLTGGGAMIEGAVELAQTVFGDVRVRIGMPTAETVDGLVEPVATPLNSTGVGLVLYGAQTDPGPEEPAEPERTEDREPEPEPDEPEATGRGFYNWLKDFLTG